MKKRPEPLSEDPIETAGDKAYVMMVARNFHMKQTGHVLVSLGLDGVVRCRQCDFELDGREL